MYLILMLSDVYDENLLRNSTDGYQSETEFSSFTDILCWINGVVDLIFTTKINAKDSYLLREHISEVHKSYFLMMVALTELHLQIWISLIGTMKL